MAFDENFFHGEDVHPIDIVEHIAATQDWEFDRMEDDQIAMAVEGKWRTYALCLAWSSMDETLRLIATFDMDPPAHRMDALHETLNAVNDNCWVGSYTYWEEQGVMVYRYGLLLTGGQYATPAQIDSMISAAVASTERFYPAFQLATWGEQPTSEAMQVAIAEAYGRA